MRKLLSTPTIIKDDIEIKQNKIGELTKEYIEQNREILEEQKKEALEKDYDKT